MSRADSLSWIQQILSTHEGERSLKTSLESFYVFWSRWASIHDLDPDSVGAETLPFVQECFSLWKKIDHLKDQLHAHSTHFCPPVWHIDSPQAGKERGQFVLLAPFEAFVASSLMYGGTKGTLHHLKSLEVPDTSLFVFWGEMDFGGIDRLEPILKALTVVHRDWRLMCERLDQSWNALTKIHEDPKEWQEFGAWLVQSGFSFLGAAFYPAGSQQNSPFEPLGIMSLNTWSALQQEGEISKKPFKIYLSRHLSPLHRPQLMDVIQVDACDAQGHVIGHHCFWGLLSSKAYDESIRYIPWVRHKVAGVLTSLRPVLTPSTERFLTHHFETLPRQEVFHADTVDLSRLAQELISKRYGNQLFLWTRLDEAAVVTCVFFPWHLAKASTKNILSEALRDYWDGEIVEENLACPDGFQGRFYAVIRSNYPKEVLEGKKSSVSLKALIQDLGRKVQPLSVKLKNFFEKKKRLELLDTWEDMKAFLPEGYEALTNMEEAAREIGLWHRKKIQGLTCVADFDWTRQSQGEISLLLSEHLPLSQLVSLLHVMQLEVDDHASFSLEKGQGALMRLKVRTVLSQETSDPVVLTQESQSVPIWLRRVVDTLEAVTSGKCGAHLGDFLGLITFLPLTWRQANLCYSLVSYLRQLGLPFSYEHAAQVLSHNGAGTLLFLEMFHHKFDPTSSGQRDELQEHFETFIDNMQDGEGRRLFSLLNALLKAMVRTTFYQPDHPQSSFLAFKFRVKDLPELETGHAAPHVWEVFVSTPLGEGIHMRAGRLARGGIRWSDRRDDYRGEVLGLVRTQALKNTLIVPTGAKGGFVLYRPYIPAEAEKVYSAFVQGLLALTDNQQGENILPPQSTRCYDEHDPYLVVAADKGTATFSDLANRLSLREDFWLGDAFASGGSQGYDHKKLAITSKGAWVCATTHLQESGGMPSPLTMIGVGDMSGDVFGNGMLQSQDIRLVAAFDHRHIFLDPSPDPLISYQERLRLFQMPRSSWEDYSPSLLSLGGGVFRRSQSIIPLTPQVQELLGLHQEKASSYEVIKALLGIKADILWFGGIGTYVRADDELDSAARDSLNDTVRIPASALKARVVAEGANLALTQRARIAYALSGGRINTDAVDNAGGVTCSDHEVNLKLLFQHALKIGVLSQETRNQWLKNLTGDVVHSVLQHVRSQHLALTWMTKESTTSSCQKYDEWMMYLEDQGSLDRHALHLPTSQELGQRSSKHQGIVRPEMAVLTACTKHFLKLHLEGVDHPLLQDLKWLRVYFPAVVTQEFESLFPYHPLRLGISATVVTNLVVHGLGVTFVHQWMQSQAMTCVTKGWSTLLDVLPSDISEDMLPVLYHFEDCDQVREFRSRMYSKYLKDSRHPE